MTTITFQERLRMWPVAQDKRVACKLSIIGSMVAILLGLFVGEVSFDINRLAQMTGMLATIFAIVLGTKVLITAWKARELLVIVSVLTIWVANLTYTFEMIAMPINDTLFDVATIVTMLVFCKYVNEHLKCRSRPCFARRDEVVVNTPCPLKRGDA